jgi:S-adenosylmethionine:tRNA ribosyltransferase-isomerase
MYSLSDFDYDLPPELIAQTPVPRGESRLLVMDRQSGAVSFGMFHDILRYVQAGDVLVINDTRVTARRFRGRRAGGGPAEALLLRPVGDASWEALVYPGSHIRPGAAITLDADDLGEVRAEVIAKTPKGGRVLRFGNADLRDALAARGEIPLPPYITEPLADEERYQTVYAREGGSAAAPTAGLHFTEELLEEVRQVGADVVCLTLHVGVDTFRPVREEDPAKHVMHGEWYAVSEDAAQRINDRTGRVLAVGTTVVRALESAADADGRVRAGSDVTHLFIRPGYRFRVVQGMLTNFHLPKSTLVMLVCAFAGYESTMKAYRQAVAERMRFYSFGDAMLVI